MTGTSTAPGPIEPDEVVAQRPGIAAQHPGDDDHGAGQRVVTSEGDQVAGNAGDSPDKDELSVLLVEYEAGREDARHNLTQQSAIIVTAVTALGAIILFGTGDDVGNVQRILLCGITFGVSTYMIVYFSSVNLRHAYHRAIEARIADRIKANISPYMVSGTQAPELRLPALGHLERMIYSQRGYVPRIAWANTIFYVVMLLVPAAVVYRLTSGMSTTKVVGGVVSVDVPAWYLQRSVFFVELLYTAFLIWVQWTTNFNPRTFITQLVHRGAVKAGEERAARAVGKRGHAEQQDPNVARNIASYLLYPRVSESFKAAYFVLACSAGFMVYRPSLETLLVAALVWVAFEPLAYQARYAWNDLRDADLDREQPSWRLRGRIPWRKPSGTPEEQKRTEAENNSNLRQAAVAMFIRLVSAFALVAILIRPEPERLVSLLLLVALVVQAAIYEAARVVTKRPERDARLAGPKLPEYFVYLLVGIGYGLRAAAGLWFGSGGNAGPGLLAATFVFLSLLGTANAIAVWLLEGSTLIRADGSAAIAKTHVTTLWRRYGPRLGSAGSQEPGKFAWLASRDVLRSPWFLAYAAAAAAAAVAGLMMWQALGGPQPAGRTLPAIVFVVIGSTAVGIHALVAIMPARFGWFVGLGLPLLVVVALAVPRNDASAILGVTPFSLMVAVYLGTRSSSHDMIAEGIARIARSLTTSVRATWVATFQWILGGKVMALLISERTRDALAVRDARLAEKYTGKVRPKWKLKLVLASVAIWTGFEGPILFILPRHLEQIDPAAKDRNLGWVLAVGAFIALVANIAAGVLSDRSKSEFGRRRPFILAGALGSGVALIGLSFTATWWQVMIAWCCAQVFLNTMLAGVVALLPDVVSTGERVGVAGLFSASQIMGPVLGGAIANSFPGAILAPCVLLAMLIVALPIPLLINAGESAPSRVVAREPAEEPSAQATLRHIVRALLGRLGAPFAAFRTQVVADRNMRWAFITRFVFQCAITVGTLYLLYFLQKTVPAVDGNFALTTLSAVLGISLASTALLVGREHRPGGHLPWFVALSGIAVATGAAILAGAALVAPDHPQLAWPMIAIGAATLGIGFGLFGPIDLAINTRVLTMKQHHGAHLGVLNSASSFPQVVGALVAVSTITTVGGYAGLYGITAILALIGSVCVLQIRSDRFAPADEPA